MPFSGGGGGGATVGNAVSGATGNEVLYADGSGNLAQSAGLKYDGTNLSCPGSGSVSEKFGASSTAEGGAGTAVGNGARARANDNTSVGYLAGANTTGTGNTVIGNSTNAKSGAINGVAIGDGTFVQGHYCTNVGRGAQPGGVTTPSKATGLGDLASVSADNATGLGADTVIDTAHASAIALGKSATTTAANQLMIGSSSYPISEVNFGAASRATIKNAAMQFSGCRVYSSVTQVVGNNVITAGIPGLPLLFDTERFDTDSYHSVSSNTSRITAPVTGYYHVGANITYPPSAAGTSRDVFLVLNRTAIIAAAARNPDTGGGQSTSVMVGNSPIHLTAGDYVEVFAYQLSGGNLTLAASDATSQYAQEFWMDLIGI